MITLTDSAHHKLDTIATSELKRAIVACRIDANRWLVTGVTVIWHGVGQTSFISLDEYGSDRTVIPVPHDDLEIIPGSKPCGVNENQAPASK